MNRVRKDLGTGSGPHPVYCRSDCCLPIFVYQNSSNNTGN